MEKTIERKLKNVETTSVNYEQVKNTPFTIVSRNDNQHIICLGDTAVTEKQFKTKKEAILYINKKSWEMLANVIIIINKKMLDYEKTIKKSNVEQN